MRTAVVIPVILGFAALLGVAAALQPQRLLSVAPSVPTPEPVAAVPVVVTAVQLRDVPITLTGIGAVTAFSTVTVTSRVDGELQSLNFEEGQFVREGDVLGQLDPRPFEATLRQNQAVLHRDRARLANAAADLTRLSELARNSFASRQSLETQQAMVEQYQADIEADQAQLDTARLQLAYATIRSPIAGRVGFRLVDVGNIVHAADRTGLVVVSKIQPIAVMFTLPEQDLGAVNRRLSGEKGLAVTALGQDDQVLAEDGRVTTIDNAIDPHTATFKVKAVFANADHALWPGQFVKAQLLLTTRRNGIVVPAEVVQRGPDGSFAYVLRADDTVEMRAVSVARIADGTALIESGLAPGERVVVDGQYRLQPGTHARVSK